MPGFARLAVAASAALMLASSSALALIEVKGETATFTWAPSTGPVSFYSVHFVKSDGDIPQTARAYVSEPEATVYGEYGDTFAVCVVAWSWNGKSILISEPSPLSEEVRFVDPDSANGGGSNPSSPDPTPPPPDPTPPPPTAPEGTGPVPYDLNGDGGTDLLWQNTYTSHVAAWLMDGTSPSSVSLLGRLRGLWHFVGSGDFDGDERADLLLQWGSGGTLEIWFMNGWFRGSASLVPPSRCSSVDAIGDFDGDGYDDLLWRCRDKSVVSFMRGASVEGEADGPLPVGAPACALDLDGNGSDEVIWRDPAATVAWWSVGSPLWRSETVGPHMNNKNAAVGCGDADGDGFDDVLWYHRKLGEAVLWKMAGDLGVVRSFELPPLGGDWTMDTSGDFDGDGRASEIVVRDTGSGEIEIWALQWNSQLTGFSVAHTADPGMGSKYWEVISP